MEHVTLEPCRYTQVLTRQLKGLAALFYAFPPLGEGGDGSSVRLQLLSNKAGVVTLPFGLFCAG